MSISDMYAPDLHKVTKENLFYTLVMFPYPSGYGLHVGHASNFVINDVLARYKRLRGYTVFNPFGFDSFGLPTENYAMKLGKPAYEVTEDNIAYYSSQVAALDLSFDTERTVVTSRPEYYKRTQRIFQQLYKAGLVYRDTLRVNRCPECQTVLANDQVIEGTCERCKSEIIQKKHPQWFIKITAYADRLIQDLDLVDRPEETKIGQKNWIGKSEGCEIDFKVQDSELAITVFTTRPDTIYGVTALVLAPENTLLDDQLPLENKTEVEKYRQVTLAKTAVQRQKDLKEKTGVFSGTYAIHPLTNEKVAIWYADYVLPDYGTGAVMMVPAHDERDREFAKKFDIEVKKVVARETGQKRQNEEFKNGGAAVIFDPKTQKYAVGERPDGRVSLFAGGVDEGENVYDAILREVREESGLYKYSFVERIETSFAHYFNQAKQVNRVARAECLLIILEDADTSDVTLEEHEKFHLARKTAAEIKRTRESSNETGQYDHYLRFLDESIARAIELGYDTTSDGNVYISTAMTEYGILENSDQFTGLTSIEAKKKIAEHLELHEVGRTKVSYKLRDRSVSRQRYRGSPIPVYYDEDNKPQLIPEEELPVVLPLDLENYKPTGKSPLEDHPTFSVYEKDGKKYHRECDTLDTFMCSSFYFLRYPDANNANVFGSHDLLNKCFPIDFYIGGKEHTVGHLLYARFIHKFLFDQGLVSNSEPFQRLVHQGMVLGADGRKMSKRRGNVIDPMEVIEKYGSDAVRTYIMFMGPVEQEKVWNDGALAGVAKFLGRMKNLVTYIYDDQKDGMVERALHKAIKGLTEDMEKLKYNTAVSKLMILLNSIEDEKKLTKDQLAICMILLFPFAPQTSRQVWTDMVFSGIVDEQSWPIYDELLTNDETISLPIQINGKVRVNVQVSPDVDESTVLALALQEDQIKKYTDGNEVKKVIYVAGKILNIVV